MVPAILFGRFAMSIALVTGTSSGIGLATSVSLARRGHRVIATKPGRASNKEAESWGIIPRPLSESIRQNCVMR